MDRYDAINDRYCYPNTSVLKNLLDIHDIDKLEDAERDVTDFLIQKIVHSKPPYNLNYLQNIHNSLFSSLYDWAGQIRDVNIAKGGTTFCIFMRIEPEIEKIFNQLQNEHWLKNLEFSIFVTKLAEYYSNFNMIHPFREGNGRVQRIFFEHLAIYCGYILDWNAVTQEEWVQANIDGFYVQYDNLARIFNRILSPNPWN